MTTYQINVFSHVNADTVRARVNDWLRANKQRIFCVHSVELSHDGKLHYATVLYSEYDD